jgi:thiol-disulfide isomerase/thioredoxin
MGRSWTIRGEVVDKNGELIEDFEAAAIWSSNGVYWNKAGVIPPEERANVWKREGVLAARPQYLAARTSKGTFSLELQDRPRAPVFVVNAEHNCGGIVLVDRSSADRPVRIELTPLVRVTAEVFCPEAGRAPDFAKAEIYVVGGDNIFLTQCGTYQGNVSFLLPPGEYEIYAEGDSPIAAMRVQKRPSDIPLHSKYARGKRFTVPRGITDFDLGVLELLLSRDSEGNAVDVTQFYGKRPPSLDIIDARGAPKDLKLEDFRGKWVLVEFWALWCPSCVAAALPELSEFYEQHSDQLDQFEILSICDTKHEGIRTIAELEPKLSAIRQNVWGGRKLPFPVLLDNESRTASAYGLAGRPSTFLIDPEGNLVNTLKEDALKMMAERLVEMGTQAK